MRQHRDAHRTAGKNRQGPTATKRRGGSHRAGVPVPQIWKFAAHQGRMNGPRGQQQGSGTRGPRTAMTPAGDRRRRSGVKAGRHRQEKGRAKDRLKPMGFHNAGMEGAS